MNELARKHEARRGYIGRAMDAGLRKEMTATVELIKGAAAADMAAHLIDSGP